MCFIHATYFDMGTVPLRVPKQGLGLGSSESTIGGRARDVRTRKSSSSARGAGKMEGEKAKREEGLGER